MIHHAIDHVVDELNAYLGLRAGVQDRVVPGTLLLQAGGENPKVTDKVVLSVVNVEEDRIARSEDILQRQNGGTFHKVAPEAKINLYVLFVANLADYLEALKSLSYVISFFQQKNFFEYAEIPELNDVSGKLVFELYSLTFEQQNHLWGALGAKYQPSVMYRLRVTTIHEALMAAVIPAVTDVDVKTD